MELEVKQSKLTYFAAVVLTVLMGPIALFSLYRGVTHMSLVPLLLGFACVVLTVAVFFLVGRGRRNSVRRFNDRGLVRGDLSELPWSDLEKVVDMLHTQNAQRYIWRHEIHFTNGRVAWIIPSKVSSYGEVRQYVDSISCEHVSK